MIDNFLGGSNFITFSSESTRDMGPADLGSIPLPPGIPIPSEKIIPSTPPAEPAQVSTQTRKPLPEFVVDQVNFIRGQIDMFEEKICAFEDREDFISTDPRYRRWISDKGNLVKMLSEVLVSFCSKGGVKDAMKVLAEGSPDGILGSGLDGDTGSLSLVDDSSIDLRIAKASDGHDQLQLDEYLKKKEVLATIMRDFSNKKIHFISAVDDSPLYVPDYQAITSLIKERRDEKTIEDYVRGEMITYKTGINKKNRTFTETKLFIPEYRDGGIPPKPMMSHMHHRMNNNHMRHSNSGGDLSAHHYSGGYNPELQYYSPPTHRYY